MHARRRSIRCSRTFVRTNSLICCEGRAAKVRPGRPEGFTSAVDGIPSTALRCSVSWPVAKLTSLTAFAMFRQTATSQFTLRAARAGHVPCAPQRRRGALRPARAHLCRQVGALSPNDSPRFCSRWAVGGRGDFWGDEERRAKVGARSVHQQLTRRVCLSEAERSERSELCGETLDRAPQCSRRTRRPAQHEPPPPTARREPRQPSQEDSKPTYSNPARHLTKPQPNIT